MKIRSLSLMGVVATAGALALPAQAYGGADSMVVVKDAVSGELRAPTADEAAALTAAKAVNAKGAARGALALLPKRHSSGAVGVRVNDDMASYSVMTKRADGTLAEICVQSKSEAEQAVQSGVLPAQQAAEK